uniref:Lipocalin/cytosolic fatty-acid binding domain-containing protein n=1 Tax=Periophthalmus magnuspinnatus TaxID=409849 RepID=A0A3B3ZUV6_9GOBI
GSYARASLIQLMLLGAIFEQVLKSAFHMSGKWYLTGFATNAQWFIIHKQTMGTGTSTFTPMDGNLDMPFESLNPDGTCFRLHNLAKKTDVPGKFTYVGSVNDMRIVDVKYDEYALIYTVKTIGDTSDAVIKAYSKNLLVFFVIFEQNLHILIFIYFYRSFTRA